MTTKGCFFRLTEKTREDLATLATRWNLDKTATLAKALQLLAEIPKNPKLSAYEASLPISLSARQSGKTAMATAMLKKLAKIDPSEIVGNFKTLRERAPIFKPSGKL